MTIKNKIKHMVTQDKTLLDSDKKLLLHYWEMQGLGLSDGQKQRFMERCTTPETITRARRELRLVDGIQGKEDIEEERFEKYQEYKKPQAVSWMYD